MVIPLLLEVVIGLAVVYYIQRAMCSNHITIHRSLFGTGGS